MRRWLILLVLAGVLNSVPSVRAENGASTSANQARLLIAAWAKAHRSTEGLGILFRLQLAAGQFADASHTLDELQNNYRSSEPRLMPTLTPWRVYLRMRQYQAQGMTAQRALVSSFQHVYAPLPDAQAASALAFWWDDHGLKAARADASTADAACERQAPRDFVTAAERIASHVKVTAMSALIPASTALLSRDVEHRYLVDDRALITTPDGAHIAAIIVRPRQLSAGRQTSLLNFTIYARDDWALSDAVQMAAHGYAGVVAYTRGKGRSTDQAIPYQHDGNDATAVINWLAKQPWSDGRVGMFSGSYNGFTQWAAAKHHPAALKAIATHATNAPGIDTPMQGNVFQSFIYYWPFYTTNQKYLDDSALYDHDRWQRMEREWYRSGRPYRQLDQIDGKPNPIFDQWLQHPSYDSYWQQLIPYKTEFASIDIPVFTETGYFDGGMVGALYYFQQHLAYRPQADDRLLIGPYLHTAMQTGVRARIDGEAVDRAALIDLQALRLAWFDHIFRHAPMPTLLSDRVNFEVMGANRWRHVTSLAAMPAKQQLYYLDGGRRYNALQLTTTTPTQAVPELRVDFSDRSDVNVQPLDDVPDTRNALLFSSAPLNRSMEIDGIFHGHLHISINKRDVDIGVQLYVQDPDGHYHALNAYLGRASYMHDRSQRELLTPGVPSVLDFDSQTVTARMLPAGSRIVVVIAVPKQPDIQINYGTGGDVSDESIKDAKTPLRITWLPQSTFSIGLREPNEAPAP